MAADSLIVRLGLNAMPFQKGLGRVDAALGKMLKGFVQLTGLGSAAGLAKLGTDALTLAAGLDHASAKIGVSTDLLQTLGFAGEQYGIKQDTTNMALQRFTRRLGEAQQGGGELLPVLKQYNVALTDSEGRARSAEDVLGDYAELLKATASPQERLRLAFKAFDSEGVGLVSTLTDGRAGLEAWGQQARDSGQLMEQETIKALSNAENAIGNFKKRVTIAIGEILVDFDSEAGLKKLGLQLLKTVGNVGLWIADGLTQAATWVPKTIGLAIATVADGFQQMLISGLVTIGEKANELLPDFLTDRGFKIDFSSLETVSTKLSDAVDIVTDGIEAARPKGLIAGFNESIDLLITEYDQIATTQRKAAQAVGASFETTAGAMAQITVEKSLQAEFNELEEKKALGILGTEKDRYEQILLITKQKDIQSKIDRLLAKGADNLTTAEKTQLRELVNQRDQLTRQIDLKTALATSTDTQLEAEKNLTDELRKQNDFKRAMTQLNRVGADDTELTTEQLQEKVRNLENQAAQQRLAEQRYAGQNYGGTAYYNPLQSIVENQLTSARAELAARRRFATFGGGGSTATRAALFGSLDEYNRLAALATGGPEKLDTANQNLEGIHRTLRRLTDG